MTRAAKAQKPAVMAFSAERKPLLEAVEAAARAAAGNDGSVPILQCLRLQASGGHVTLTGTDMDMEVAGDTPAIVEAEGQACVNGPLLVHALRAAGPEPRIELDGDRLKLRSSDGEAELGTMAADTFPVFPLEGDPGPVGQFPGEQLQGALQRVRAAVSSEETRYCLKGVHVELGRTTKLTATDGARLHHVVLEGVEVEGTATGLLPRRAVEAILALPEAVTLQLRRGFARITSGPICLTTRLIDGTFPDYHRVIPADGAEHRSSVKRKDLVAAVNRVRWAGEGKARTVQLELGTTSLRLVCSGDPRLATASTEIAAEDAGPPVEVGFNAAYLLAALNALGSEKVRLNGASRAGPWLLMDDERPQDRIVLMPIGV